MVRTERGDIWLCALDPTLGSEIQKTRPCLVVSPPEINDHLRVITVVPLTAGSHPAPFRIHAAFQGKNGLILLDQIRTLDHLRLVKRLGEIDAPTLRVVLKQLRDYFQD